MIFAEQDWSQEMKVKVNSYFHKQLEAERGLPEDLVELVDWVFEQGLEEQQERDRGDE